MGFIMRAILLVALVIGACAVSYAGNESGGGGGLLKDSHNPWFLQNTTDVNYCILLDPANFHQTEEVADQFIQKIFSYYKAEFRNSANTANVGGVNIEIATQNFRRTQCNEFTDIRFQFGYLTSEQRKIFDDPRNYIGHAQLEKYDRTQLRGKGFIYISADEGDLKPVGPNLLDRPWNEGKGELLYWVLLHEIGHVFGLQHEIMGSFFMDERFPEMVVTRGSYERMGRITEAPNFFKFQTSLWNPSICTAASDATPNPPANKPNNKSFNWGDKEKFFGAKIPYRCISAIVSRGKIDLTAFDHDGKTQPIGTITWNDEPVSQGGRYFEPIVRVWLSSEQAVFPKKLTVPETYLGASRFSAEEIIGTYTSADGKTVRQVFGTITPLGTFYLDGIMDGALYRKVF